MGYTCHAVNYLHPLHHQNNQARIPIRSISSLRSRAFWLLKKHGFRNFDRSICKHPFTSNLRDVPWDDFDLFVVGSDVVWDFENPEFGHDPVYFGAIDEMAGKPMIAYAASVGPANISDRIPFYVREGLSRFEAIGVRDDATAAFVRRVSGKDASIVVDPTWLSLDPETRWSGLPKEKYLFVYGRGADSQIEPLVREYASREGLKIVGAITPCKVADRMYRVLTPFQWVQLFKNSSAALVVGSLHGTVYAIKYSKPFLLVTSSHTTQKISSILDRCEQASRLYQPGTVTQDALCMLRNDASIKRPSIPADWQERSKAFLSESLAAAVAKVSG